MTESLSISSGGPYGFVDAMMGTLGTAGTFLDYVDARPTLDGRLAAIGVASQASDSKRVNHSLFGLYTCKCFVLLALETIGFAIRFNLARSNASVCLLPVAPLLFSFHYC